VIVNDSTQHENADAPSRSGVAQAVRGTAEDARDCVIYDRDDGVIHHDSDGWGAAGQTASAKLATGWRMTSAVFSNHTVPVRACANDHLRRKQMQDSPMSASDVQTRTACEPIPHRSREPFDIHSL
jgi:hypothetical protein